MKTKLTLYVEEEVVRRGKSWAKRHRVPLSRVIEAHLKSLGQADPGEMFLERWQGTFKLDESMSEDPRVAAILAKHAR